MKRRILVIAGLLVFANAVTPAQRTTGLLQGAWRVIAYTPGATGKTNSNPQPGFVLFTGKHYAIVRDGADKARAPFKDPGHPTPQEAVDIWGAFQAQAGTYEVAGDRLTTHILTAKNPQYQPTSGVADHYSFRFDGDTLTLSHIAPDGDPPNVIKLVRSE